MECFKLQHIINHDEYYSICLALGSTQPVCHWFITLDTELLSVYVDIRVTKRKEKLKFTFKHGFYKIFFPLLGTVFAVLLTNIDSLTSKAFIEIVLFVGGVSLVGGLIIWLANYLVEYLGLKNFNKIKKAFSGKKTNENILNFNYKGIDTFCERIIDANNMSINKFNFHVPRRFIKKYHRKNFDFIKPSKISKEKCFMFFSTRVINKKSINKLKNRIQLISEKNKKNRL